MSAGPTRPRRRRAGAIAAISGGSAAASIGLSRHHEAAGGHHPLVWQDIGFAAAIVLIAVALVALVIAGLRRGR